MDATTARETLHGWIDDADDATVISVAELLASLKARGLLRKADPQPTMKAIPFTMDIDNAPALPRTITMEVNDSPQTTGERREEADRLARAGGFERLGVKVRYVNRQGQETDKYGKALPSDDA